MTSMPEASDLPSHERLGDSTSLGSVESARGLGEPVGGTRDVSMRPSPPSISTTVAQDNRLPPETFAEIFIHLSKQGPTLPRRKTSNFVRDLVSVTHVCRYWRQTAINTPGLWTEITMKNVKAVKAFLKRSGELPLNVDLNSDLGSSKIVDAVIPHTHRFRQLSAFSYEDLRPFTKPAPLLERLVIHYFPEGREILLFNNQTPQLRELMVAHGGLWLKNQLGNLTSLHFAISCNGQTHAAFHPFFDMLRRCPVLEDMVLFSDGGDVQLVPPQLPTIPLHHLRKLLLHSFSVESLNYFLRIFDLGTNGIAIHLSNVDIPEGDDPTSSIQTLFQNGRSGQPSFVSSTKLEFIFRMPRTIVIHAVGPGFAIRIGLCLFDPAPPRQPYSIPFGRLGSWDVECTIQDIFPSVRQLWIRGPSHVNAKLYGIQHFTALEKLVLIWNGSNLARSFRQALSPDPSGVLRCPLLATIDCCGSTSEMDEMFLLVRARSEAGCLLEELRVPAPCIPLPANIAPFVGSVGSLDMPSGMLNVYAAELPEFCFVDGRDRDWQAWNLD